MYYLGLSYLSFRISLLIYGRKHIRIVNYHDTASINNKLFEKHLRFYKQYYEDVNFADLESFLHKKEWKKQRPGLIISFDDGLRSNYDQAVPLLRKWGFTGWFCIAPAFTECRAEQQEGFSHTNRINFLESYADSRIAMSWNELNLLRKEGHVIVNHTMHHHRMSEADTNGQLATEIVDSNKKIEQNMNFAPRIFCWVGGEEYAYTLAAFRQIKSNFGYAFMTNSYPVFQQANPYLLNRTNIETNNPLSLALFQLSGVIDILYYKKRTRLSKKFLVAN